MEVLPTWDLFILVFFAIIVAYSFIIGRDYTLKIIISTYIAILTADGIANILDKLFVAGGEASGIFTYSTTSSVIIFKILIFVFSILLLTVRGRFIVATGRENSAIVSIAITGAFGFLSAGLIVSTILVYMTGGSFLDGASVTAAGLDISDTSSLASLMTKNYNVWFSLPAIAFVVASLVASDHPAHPAE